MTAATTCRVMLSFLHRRLRGPDVPVVGILVEYMRRAP